MIPERRATILGYMAALFLAGAVSGALVAWQLAERQFAALRPAVDLTAVLRDRLNAAVALSEDQKKQVEPLIAQAGARMQQMRLDHIAQYSRARADLYRRLEPLLSPEQRRQLSAVENKYLDDIQRRYHLPPPPAAGAAEPRQP